VRIKQKLISFDAREALAEIKIPEPRELLALFEKDGMNTNIAAELRIYGLPIAKVLIPRLFERGKLQGIISSLFRRSLAGLTPDEAKRVMPEIGSMVEIPGGRYTLGDNDGEYDDEKPEHTVIVDPYAIDIFTVTNGQFREGAADLYRFREFWAAQGWQLKEAKGWSQPRFWGDKKNKKFNGDSQPVVGVSWYEAFAYLIWRSKQEGIDSQGFLTDKFFDLDKIYDKANSRWIWEGYRFPTEAEIEIAIRGGLEGEKYPWTEGLEGKAHYGQGKNGVTVEVNDPNFPANGYGLRHSVGNVWTWGFDWFGSEYYQQLQLAEQKTETIKNPIGPDTDNNRVVRGGSWDYTAGYLCVAGRYDFDPDGHGSNLGFRGARSL